MSLRCAARRGATAAVHTDVQLLHLEDFTQHVASLMPRQFSGQVCARWCA